MLTPIFPVACQCEACNIDGEQLEFVGNSLNQSTKTFVTRILTDKGRAVVFKIPVTKLRISQQGHAPQVVEVETAVVRVGSAASGNDVVLEDDAVSRYHFTIAWDEHGPRLRDLESTNGTYVDGTRVIDVYLTVGATIQVGRSQLMIEEVGRTVDEPLYAEDRFGPLVGRSAAMRRLFSVLEKAAPTEVTVLVEGETGTGKELVAQALHENSTRREGPFVVVDCAAMPAETLQSELFGHEQGAFTGATGRRLGQIELAHGGTLFLDEIGELPLELQPNLLRVLEAREIRRLGQGHPKPVDLRVVAATNRNLALEVNRGTFREDLYYRLSIVNIEVPPLRDRRDDVPLLVEHLTRRLLKDQPERASAALRSFTPAALQALGNYRWPGNVRELRNLVERTLALDELALQQAPSVTVSEDVPALVADVIALDVNVDLSRPMIEQRGELVERFERTYLTALMSCHNGKIAPASRASGLDRAYLRRLLKKYR